MKVIQIGTGGWGKNHCRVLSEFNVLSAICDMNDERAKEFGEKYNVNYYNSTQELFDKEEFDAAFICTPTSTHSELALELISRKKHVFVEKPMTYLSDDGEKLQTQRLGTATHCTHCTHCTLHTEGRSCSLLPLSSDSSSAPRCTTTFTRMPSTQMLPSCRTLTQFCGRWEIVASPNELPRAFPQRLLRQWCDDR